MHGVVSKLVALVKTLGAVILFQHDLHDVSLDIMS